MPRILLLLPVCFAACNGHKTDDDGDPPAAVDEDGDGYTAEIDCDDAHETVHPDAPEICDALDNDCDGLLDDLDSSLEGGTTAYVDQDGDDHGDPASAVVVCDASGLVASGDDCDDGAADVSPGGVEVCGDGVDQDCTDGDAACPSQLPTAPIAPTAGHFMWQGVQTEFSADGVPCTGSLALGMGDQAFCYVDTAGALLCAGRIYTETYGPSFTPTGLQDVKQVLMIPTVNVENGNGACALVDGVPTCLAYYNFSGQLGTGGTASSDVWTPWSAGTGIEWLASGTSDQFCGPDASGQVWCTGYNYGDTPLVSGTTSGPSAWIDTFGELHLDDPAVLRTSQGRSECTVRAGGLVCGATWGTPGHVVDGGTIEPEDPNEEAYEAVVWLEDNGSVHRGLLRYDGFQDQELHLTDMPVLAIAYNRYTDTVCGVYNDGSLACFGSNTQGKLGTGNAAPLPTDTVVLPPGTFDPQCQ